MASFDFFKAVTRSYKFVGKNFEYLAVQAFPVIFVVLFCNLLILYMGVEGNVLRAGLMLLPAYFVQGYFYSQLVRFKMYGEPILFWGYVRKKNIPEYQKNYLDREADPKRKADIMAGTILYLLPFLFLHALNGIRANAIADRMATEQEIAEAAPDPTFVTFIVVMLLIMAIIWTFKLFFIYVAAARGISIRDYFKSMAGMNSSSCMLFVIVLGAFPILLGTFFIMALMMATGLSTSVGFLIAQVLLSAATVFAWGVVTIAIAFGIEEVFDGPQEDDKKSGGMR